MFYNIKCAFCEVTNNLSIFNIKVKNNNKKKIIKESVTGYIFVCQDHLQQCRMNKLSFLMEDTTLEKIRME